MTVRLFTAPAAAGKTSACIDRVRSACRERPLAPVWVCLPNAAQVNAFRQRLAQAGGALGVQVGTFRALYREVLLAAWEPVTPLVEPLEYRLVRAIIDQAAARGELQHYLSLRDKPGFTRVLHELIRNLKRALIEPGQFAAAVAGQGPRLEELAVLYAAYQRRLHDEGWIDGEELAWRAMNALERQPALCAGWALVAVDGFDHLYPAQVAFLACLGQRVPELWVTLTYGPRGGRLAQRRFEESLARLQADLAVESEPLPGASVHLPPVLAHVEAHLFEPQAGTGEPGTVIAWLEAPTPPLEVRAVLRWVKGRLVSDGLAPSEVAILARNLDVYAPFLQETAQEFGIPLHLAQGLPLARNPAVAALMGLLSLPRSDRVSATVPDGRLPVRQVLQAWRSAYFDWQHCEVGSRPLGLTPEMVDHLEYAARQARVVAGLQQWEEALSLRLQEEPESREPDEAETPERPQAGVPREGWAALKQCFDRFVERITPPSEATIAEYAGFVEDLIGDDPRTPGYDGHDDRASLHMLACICGDAKAQRACGEVPCPRDRLLCERDTAALRALKDALRGLVWADAALGQGERVPYERFLDELIGVVDAASYRSPDEWPANAVPAASVSAARGVYFRAVAVLGLSEGLFPAPPPVDPLLRDTDRRLLAAKGLVLEPGPAGADFTLFYEAVTRGRERLLLSRPYLGADGQPWTPSPFWEETLRLFDGRDQAVRERLVMRVRSADLLPLAQAASWPELLAALSQKVQAGEEGVEQLVGAVANDPGAGALWQGVVWGAGVLRARQDPTPAGPFEGDCTGCRPVLATRYAPDRPWSASRLEAYLACPFAFYLGNVLELAPPMEPVVGFDAAQLGNMIHAILEGVYREAGAGGLDDLLRALPLVADRVLGEAPTRYGFRAGPLWEQEQASIRQDVGNTLRALDQCSAGWQPHCFELGFGRPGDALPAQWVEAGEGERFLLRGIVDRVDRDSQGQLRVIDYKTSSRSIGPADLLEGHRVQLALYAQVVPQLLTGGTVTEGFYWHVRKATRSSLTLGRFDGGPEGAGRVAAARAWQAIRGAQMGDFRPQPDNVGCPSYCPGSAFCWRYGPQRP